MRLISFSGGSNKCVEKCFFFLKKKEEKKGPLISGSNAELYLESGNPLFALVNVVVTIKETNPSTKYWI